MGVYLEAAMKALLEVARSSVQAVCLNLYNIISHQISQPVSRSKYIHSVTEASKITFEGPQHMTPELNRIFAILYRAIFDDKAKGNKSSAGAHLTAVKVIAKSLG
jgi:hypothetical protein